MVEALGAGVIPAEFAEVLVDHFRTVCKDRAALLAEKLSGRGIHSFMAQLGSEEDPVPGLEQVTLVGVDPNVMVHLMHFLLSVWVDIYLTIRLLFACLGELHAEGLPQVVEIPHEAFVEQCSICAVPQVDHITHLGGISPPDFQTKPCERAGKTAGTDYIDLACRGLTFVSPDCAAWLLERKVGGPLNVLEALNCLFPPITVQDLPFEEALDWLQLTYTADRVGDYVEPASTVLAHSVVVEGGELFSEFLSNLRRLYPEVYGPAVSLGWVPERRKFLLGEREGLSGSTSVNSFIKLGAYAGRFNHINLARMNNPSPNLTTVYLDTPLVGLTPEPLDYVPLLGRLEQPCGYPPTRTGGVPHTGAPKSPPPSPTSTL